MPTEETPSEILADEVADVALEDPERAAQLVSAVSAARPPVPPPAPAPTGLAGFASADRAIPAAIVGVLLLQGLTKGRIRRLVLAVAGSALVAGLVSGKQQSPPTTG